MSALIRKMHEAKIAKKKKLILWGTGLARREYLFSEDLVEGLIYLMNNNINQSYINIGSGKDISIKELADLIKRVVGFEGSFFWDTTKPDGMPQKLMDSSKAIKLNWNARTTLENGILKTYEWYLDNQS